VSYYEREKDYNYNRRDYNTISQDRNIADNYQTSPWFFRAVIDIFSPKVDIAGDSKNSLIKGSPLHDKGFNALTEDWSQFKGLKYCFPPFSKPFFNDFLIKARAEMDKGESTLFLAPLKTISMSYFESVKCPTIYVVVPRLRHFYNGSALNEPDSSCLLHYDASIGHLDTPRINYLDLKKYLPGQNERR
jgi:hypothetical protein